MLQPSTLGPAKFELRKGAHIGAWSQAPMGANAMVYGGMLHGLEDMVYI